MLCSSIGARNGIICGLIYCVLRFNHCRHRAHSIDTASWQNGDERMRHRPWLLAALALLCASTVSHAQQQGLAVQEIAPGVFVHEGVTALMTRGKGGGIANIGFIVGDSAVAVIDTGGSVHEGRQLLASIRSRTDKPI